MMKTNNSFLFKIYSFLKKFISRKKIIYLVKEDISLENDNYIIVGTGYLIKDDFPIKYYVTFRYKW